jgi:hypothetical protein
MQKFEYLPVLRYVHVCIDHSSKHFVQIVTFVTGAACLIASEYPSYHEGPSTLPLPSSTKETLLPFAHAALETSHANAREANISSILYLSMMYKHFNSLAFKEGKGDASLHGYSTAVPSTGSCGTLCVGISCTWCGASSAACTPVLPFPCSSWCVTILTWKGRASSGRAVSGTTQSMQYLQIESQKTGSQKAGVVLVADRAFLWMFCVHIYCANAYMCLCRRQ